MDKKKGKKEISKPIEETKKEEKDVNKKRKAFTLIELLAVIIILGILMIIAIPAVTSYIQDSRKSAYVDTAKNVVAGARNVVNEGKYEMYDSNATYYLPYKMIKSENEIVSPYGKLDEAYVVVTYNGKGYEYYWESIDETKTGMYLTYYDSLDIDKIATDMRYITTNYGIGNRTKIVVFNEDGTIKETKEATNRLSERGSLNKDDFTGNGMETSASFFVFDDDNILYNLFPKVSVVINDYNACANFIYNDGWFDTLEEADDFCRNHLAEEAMYADPEDLEYLMENGAITSYSITPYPKDIVIPEQINGVPVDRIDSGFFQVEGIESIVIPSTVTEIHYNGASSDLHNIVNTTGKSFDWYYTYNDKVTFEYGVIPAGSLANQPVVVSETKESNVTIDYEDMFTITDTSDSIIYNHCYFSIANITLNNNDGYDVSYLVHDTDNYVPMNNGDSINLVPCVDKIRLMKNGTVYFDGFPMEYLQCFC